MESFQFPVKYYLGVQFDDLTGWNSVKSGDVIEAPTAARALAAAAGTQMVPFAGSHSSSDPQHSGEYHPAGSCYPYFTAVIKV